MTAERRLIFIGCATLAALLAAFIVPNFQRGAASLSHPDPVGPTAYSKSAIGHLAFQRLLEQLDIPTSISQSGSGAHVAGDDCLVIAEPRADSSTLAEVQAMLTAHTVLLVLPKRTGTPDPQRPYWLATDKLVDQAAVARVLQLVDKNATVVRAAPLSQISGDPSLAGSPTIQQPQLIRSNLLHPLMAAPGGMLIAERRTHSGRIVVLSDPDLIANHSLAHGDNATLAVSLIARLRAGQPEGTVIFDEFIHGFSPRPFHMLGILFQFPFILVTAQMALAVALAAWAAAARFAVSVPLAPPLAAGKHILIDTGARLLARSGRTRELSECYLEELVRDTARRLRAPRGLDSPALLAWLAQAPGAPPPPAATATPREVWTWRKELLGESRPHTQPH